MPLQLSCPTCGKNMNVADELQGKMVRCPGCQGTLPVRVPTQAPVLRSAPALTTPPSSQTITVTCRGCQTRLKVPANKTDQLRCPKCASPLSLEPEQPEVDDEPVVQTPEKILPGERIRSVGGGVLILVPNVLTLLVLAGFAIFVMTQDVELDQEELPMLLAIYFPLVVYHIVICAAAVGMIMGMPRWAVITTSGFALLPVHLVSLSCFGIFLSPIAFAGGILGLINSKVHQMATSH